MPAFGGEIPQDLERVRATPFFIAELVDEVLPLQPPKLLTARCGKFGLPAESLVVEPVLFRKFDRDSGQSYFIHGSATQYVISRRWL